MRRLIHLSDLHIGQLNTEFLFQLQKEILDAQPDLLVVSGNLTQRARPQHFKKACQFLQNLPFQKIIVPGERDIPRWNLILRFTDPLARYRHYITENLSPSFEDEELSVQGLLSTLNLQNVLQHWSHLKAPTLKILVSHRPLHLPEADLVLSGQDTQGEKTPAEQVLLAQGHSVVNLQAGSAFSEVLGQVTETYNFIEISPGQVHYEKRFWDATHKLFATEVEKNFYLTSFKVKTSIQPQLF